MSTVEKALPRPTKGFQRRAVRMLREHGFEPEDWGQGNAIIMRHADGRRLNVHSTPRNEGDMLNVLRQRAQRGSMATAAQTAFIQERGARGGQEATKAFREIRDKFLTHLQRKYGVPPEGSMRIRLSLRAEAEQFLESYSGPVPYKNSRVGAESLASYTLQHDAIKREQNHGRGGTTVTLKGRHFTQHAPEGRELPSHRPETVVGETAKIVAQQDQVKRAQAPSGPVDSVATPPEEAAVSQHPVSARPMREPTEAEHEAYRRAIEARQVKVNGGSVHPIRPEPEPVAAPEPEKPEPPAQVVPATDAELKQFLGLMMPMVDREMATIRELVAESLLKQRAMYRDALEQVELQIDLLGIGRE